MKHKFTYISRRIAAYLIDCILAFSFYLITQTTVLAVVREMISENNEWMKVGWYSELYTIITISIPVWLYFTFTDSRLMRGSIGKRIVKLKVLSADSEQAISVKKSFARTVLKLLPWELAHIGNNFPVPMYFTEEPELRLGFILSGIFLMVYIFSFVINKSNRTVYDLLMGTEVANYFTTKKTAND